MLDTPGHRIARRPASMGDHELGTRLAMIARDVQSGQDVGQAVEEIAAAAVDLLPAATGAGVTLVHGRREVETAAATNDLVREGDRLQYELVEGPCLDAAWEQEQVYAGDLATDERWPTWAPRVVAELGVHSLLSAQLFTHENHHGALNIYSTERHAFDAEDRDVARLLAAHAAVAVASAQEVASLKVAVDRRTTIGKALGIIMATYGLDDDQAMAVLRRLSSQQNRKLYDLAVEVIDGMKLPDRRG
jgi:GAF domain-containing protein